MMKFNQELSIKEIESQLPGSNSLFAGHERMKKEQQDRLNKFEEGQRNSLLNYQSNVYNKKQEQMQRERLINLRDQQ